MTGDERHTGPSGRHADLDTLADLHAGALDDAEAARIREHVAGCRQCAAALEALDAVQGRLRSLPAPAMPAAVAARLDATLADLRSDRSAAAAPAALPVPDPEDELALARARRGRRLSRAIGAAAAAVVVIAAGGAITSIVRGGGASDTSSSAGGAASAPQPQAGQPGYKSSGGGSADNGPGITAQEALPEYDQASLRAALPAIAASRGVSTASGGPSAAPAAGGMSDPAKRTACAASIPGTTGSLRAVEHISYQGRPAYVFVYADGGRLTGYVVTEACGSTPGLPAAVLTTVS